MDEVTVDLDVVARMDLLAFFQKECEQVGSEAGGWECEQVGSEAGWWEECSPCHDVSLAPVTIADRSVIHREHVLYMYAFTATCVQIGNEEA